MRMRKKTRKKMRLIVPALTLMLTLIICCGAELAHAEEVNSAIAAPTITVEATGKPGEAKITISPVMGAKGYKLQTATDPAFGGAQELKVPDGKTEFVVTWLVPKKVNYIRVCSWGEVEGKKDKKEEVFSEWSAAQSVQTKGGKTITNVASKMAIEADVNLKGSGSGYHAKLVMCTPTSAVSFGLQYDKHAVAPYTGKMVTLIENVSSNNAGGQVYTRPSGKALKKGKTYHLMMTVDKKGKGNVYLDYKKIGSFTQKNLKKGECYLRIEACARLNGDKVDATFSNVKCKWNGQYEARKTLGYDLGWNEFKQNKGLKYAVKDDGSIRMWGKIKGINGDWDSDYEAVSEILQFQ